MDYVKICSFKDLLVWKKGHELVLYIYKLTKKYPNEEKYSLADQMRRAVVSVTSNIAEGFSRKSYKEKMQFYYQSFGSLTELENQLIISKDLQYITVVDFNTGTKMIISVQKLLHLFIAKTKTLIPS